MLWTVVVHNRMLDIGNHMYSIRLEKHRINYKIVMASDEHL